MTQSGFGPDLAEVFGPAHQDGGSELVQLLTPDSLRGRVSSIHILVVTGGPRVGDAEASAVAALIGTQWSVVSGGVLSLLGVGLLTLAMPEFVRLRMDEAREAAERDEVAVSDAAAEAALEATAALEEVGE